MTAKIIHLDSNREQKLSWLIHRNFDVLFKCTHAYAWMEVFISEYVRQAKYRNTRFSKILFTCLLVTVKEVENKLERHVEVHIYSLYIYYQTVLHKGLRRRRRDSDFQTKQKWKVEKYKFEKSRKTPSPCVQLIATDICGPRVLRLVRRASLQTPCSKQVAEKEKRSTNGFCLWTR